MLIALLYRPAARSEFRSFEFYLSGRQIPFNYCGRGETRARKGERGGRRKASRFCTMIGIRSPLFISTSSFNVQFRILPDPGVMALLLLLLVFIRIFQHARTSVCRDAKTSFCAFVANRFLVPPSRPSFSRSPASRLKSTPNGNRIFVGSPASTITGNNKLYEDTVSDERIRAMSLSPRKIRHSFRDRNLFQIQSRSS